MSTKCATKKILKISQYLAKIWTITKWDVFLRHGVEIRSVERVICPIATLYSLAAAFQSLTLLWACSQFCLWIKTVGCYDVWQFDIWHLIGEIFKWLGKQIPRSTERISSLYKLKKYTKNQNKQENIYAQSKKITTINNVTGTGTLLSLSFDVKNIINGSTPWSIKTSHFYFLNSSVKHWPILIILARNIKKNDANDCSFGYLTLILSLHYLVKCRFGHLQQWIHTG